MRRAIGSAVSTVLALVAFAGFSGCGESRDPVSPVIPGALPDSIPLATSPANFFVRFEAAYEFAVLAEYDKLVTADYRFTFSNQSDPDLVVRYGNAWSKTDEMASTSHLFTGFTNEAGEYQAPAASIQLSFAGLSIVDDPDHPDSASHYRKVVVPGSDATIELGGGTLFSISAPLDFYLVRGDAAVLDATQEARADRWYVHRWVDRSAALGAIMHDAHPATWGAVKHWYR